MNIQYFFSFIFFATNTLFYAASTIIPSSHSPLLTVVIMIKNEETAIEATLQPYLEAGIKDFLVLDTGSTDNTLHIVRNIFKKYQIKHGYIVEQPFVDFATSRNYALECAEKQFPHAHFFLMPDAEWYLQNIKGLLQFCKDHINDPETSFGILIYHASEKINFYVYRFFKAHKGIKFEGAIHEMINYISPQNVPHSSYFIWNPSKKGAQQSLARKTKDLEILLKEYEKNPRNPRTLFYIGQTYAALQDWQNACAWYKKRCELNDYKSEKYFITLYRIASIYEMLQDWDNALIYFFKAYNARPTRAEPLIHLAQYYCDTKEYGLAYKFALMAVNIPYPTTDRLLIEQELYNFARYDILGCAAWHVGQFKIGEKAVKQAIQSHPERTYLYKTLQLYASRKILKKNLSGLQYPHHYFLNSYYKFSLPLITAKG